MPDINKILKTAFVLQKKVQADLENLYGMFESATKDVNGRFRDEYQRNNGNMIGLEDFFMLNTLLKKNSISVRNALNLIRKMRAMDGYNISEEQIEDKELEEILNT